MSPPSLKTPTDHMWQCWEDPSGAGYRLRQSIEKSNAAVLNKINKINLRVYYLLGGIAAIVALLGFLHFRIGNFEASATAHDDSAVQFREKAAKIEKADTSSIIRSAHALETK